MRAAAAEFNLNLSVELASQKLLPTLKVGRNHNNSAHQHTTHANGNAPQEDRVRKFRNNFKEINFTTLKQRHDNFSFEKTIESRPLVYDSIHF